MNTSSLEPDFLEASTETLRAVAHPIRLAIISLLHEQERLTVTEIYQQLNIEQAIASHHLRILKNRNIVDMNRDGKNSIYYLVSAEYIAIIQALQRVL